MTITFADLVKIYRQSEFITNSDKALFCSNSAEDYELLTQLASDEHYDETAIEILSGKMEVGEKIELGISQPQFKLGRLFNNFEAFIQGDMGQLHSVISQSEYFIKDDKVVSFDAEKPDYYHHYEKVKQFVQQLNLMAAYADNVNKKLVFFSKKTFELSIAINKQVEAFSQCLKALNSEQIQILQGFSEWLNDEETSSHIDEKKSILAFVFADTLPQGATIIDVLQQIKQISEAVQNQYALYLENFSYEKFVKKLTENSEKFVTKVNDTISKMLPQFLGLPFLTAIPTALKSGDNWLMYAMLCLYCAMCYLGLTYQKQVLDNLKDDVEQFEQKGNIPIKLQADWLLDKTKIDNLISKQEKLYCLLLFSVICCFLYGFAKLCLQFHILEVHCG
ncbi:hypothetical protein [Exercitatus varius]|uniref:Uncharacterized protein n=1 Tax=Exercitatus varius TaxID=67857 RepID=A0AAW6Q7L4_9PAST|nr:hypothetical protein [Exercitatus varius]MDG2949323.1 hypothetical protein [Exercitatus varius]